MLFIFAGSIAKIFEKDPETSLDVIKSTISYLKIVPIGYGFQGIVLITSIALNALKKPFLAFLLTIIEMFVLCLPLSLIFANIYNASGVFIAISISYISVGIISHLLVSRILLNISKA